ncbi:MAG: C25 family cysteine peptidase, partial [Gammaproteobacteria bacterium]
MPVSYVLGISSDDALARGRMNPVSTEAPLDPRIIYVAVPDCDGVTVECRVHDGARTDDGSVLRKPDEKLARVIAVSRIRDQSVAVLSVNAETVQRLHMDDDESLQLTLHFRNSRGPIVSDLGPMTRSMDRLLVRDRRAAIRDRGTRRPIVASADGQVTWATGSTWQQAMQSAIDANTDYLMIMADELSDVLVDSLAYKRATVNDLNVTIVKMSQIDSDPDTLSTPATIRDFIKGVYDSRSAAHSSDSLLSYVLLIGDAVRPDATTLIPSYNGFT